MSGVTINTGGGGLVIGSGTATGAGSVTIVGNTAEQTETRRMAAGDLAALIGALGGVKAALIGGGVPDAAALATRVVELESRVLKGDGVVDVGDVRHVLGRLRAATVALPPVAEAIAQASAPVRRGKPYDVFVSYKREDRTRITPHLDALRALAVDVWIDDHLKAGDAFTQVICEEIDVCRAQLVFWSPASASSDWVRGEAEFGRRRSVLVPVMLEACTLAPPFNMVHAEDFTGWRGDMGADAWQRLMQAIGPLIGRPALDTLSRALSAKDSAAINAWVAAHPEDAYAIRARQARV